METIRPLTKSDISSVAQLFQKVFRHTNAPAPASLVSYFEQIYLNNPWRDEAINSLVYERDGNIDGFLGAIPFPMILNGKSIRAVIGGNYMINPEHPNPLAGVKILKTLFSGPQDVTYSDTATETARKIWEGLGSKTVQLYSMQWLRVLRPSQFALVMGTRNSILAPLSQILKPALLAADTFFSVVPKSPFKMKASPLHGKELTVRDLLTAIQKFSSRFALKPDYNETTLTWLINEAKEKQEYGPLKSVALFNAQNVLQGWYLYYPNAGKMGHVLQLFAQRQSIDAVLTHLFTDAKNEGSLALSGQAEPKFIQEFSAHGCIFNHRNFSTVVHTGNNDFLNALNSGNAFFTRLEGEWWTRLQGDRF